MSDRASIPVSEEQKTIVLLDVDGVVNWWSMTAVQSPEVDRHEIVDRWAVLIPKGVPGLVRELVDRHDVRWCTAWREMANEYLVDILEIDPLPVLTDKGRARGADWKLDQVITLALEVENPIVWIEDFAQSWLDPHAVSAHLDGRVHLVDTSEAGYLRRGDLESLFEEGVL